MTTSETIHIATRGSALALAQANMVMNQCRAAFPTLNFALRIIKTTGDKLQTASMAQEGHALPKGLFTKELEIALMNLDADLAVHSLKDLPTELPQGLTLGAVSKREDVRDVLLYRDETYWRRQPGGKARRGFRPGLRVADLPSGAVVATSSTRRKAQLLAINANLSVPDIRGNVATRMRKLAEQPELDGTVLALAGMTRLRFGVGADGEVSGEDVPEGLLAVVLETHEMLPCVGQGAIGIEIRRDDRRMSEICAHLNHAETQHCVLAERAFLAAMGGGCQSPVAAHALVDGLALYMRAVSFASGPPRRAEGRRPLDEPETLGGEIAEKLKH